MGRETGILSCTSDEESHEEKSRRKSIIWNYFTIQNDLKGVAVCNLCNKVRSYRTTTSNLSKHLRNVHKLHLIHKECDGVNEDEKTNIEQADVKNTPLTDSNNSVIWDFFKCIDEKRKIARCLKCHKLLSHDDSNDKLISHLKKKHSHSKLPDEAVDKPILLSVGDQLYEIETQKEEKDEAQEQTQPLEMDEVYLEDFHETTEKPIIIEEIVQKPKTIQHSRPRKFKRTRRTIENFHSESSDDEQTYSQESKIKNQKDSNVDNFGKYLTFILKQLPNKISLQLQRDFIKQALNAQIACEEKSSVNELTNSSYSVKITDENISETTVAHELQKTDHDKNNMDTDMLG